MNNPIEENLQLLHGGDVAAAQALFGGRREDWLDLSTGINPAAYVFDWPAEPFATRLPQKDDLNRLLAAAQKYYGVKSPDSIVAAPGTQALIQLLPRLFPPTSVAILGPTYEEHAACWRRAGHRVDIVEDVSDATGAQIAIIVNPNNPTGKLLPADDLFALREKMARNNGLLVVDEAFADVTPNASISSEAGRGGLLVLRSFGKFFGLAGLRLGFALSSPSLAAKLRQEIGPWAVSGPAIAIGATALADQEWVRTARLKLAQGSEQLDALLISAGMEIVGGTHLFRLGQSRVASDIATALARSHILVRRFAVQPQWLRFGLPGKSADFERLREALFG